MSGFWTSVLVALGGGVGAVARLVADGAIRARWPSGLPWATVVINVSGSFVLGLLTGWAASGSLPHLALGIAGTGFCGGFTTFSTSVFETVRLVQQGRWGGAALVALGTLVLAVAAAALGLLVAG